MGKFKKGDLLKLNESYFREKPYDNSEETRKIVIEFVKYTGNTKKYFIGIYNGKEEYGYGSSWFQKIKPNPQNEYEVLDAFQNNERELYE